MFTLLFLTPLPVFLSAASTLHGSWLPDLALGALCLAAIWVACCLIAFAGLMLGGVVLGLLARPLRAIAARIRRRLTPDAYTALVTITPDGARRIAGTRRRFARWRQEHPEPPPAPPRRR